MSNFSLYMEYSVIYPYWIMAFKQKLELFPLDFGSLKIGLPMSFSTEWSILLKRRGLAKNTYSLIFSDFLYTMSITKVVVVRSSSI